MPQFKSVQAISHALVLTINHWSKSLLNSGFWHYIWIAFKNKRHEKTITSEYDAFLRSKCICSKQPFCFNSH
jgi:hypothetical protein